MRNQTPLRQGNNLTARTLSRLLAAVVLASAAAVALLSPADAEQATLTFEPVTTADINAAHKARALQVGDATLKGWKAGRFEVLPAADFAQQLAAVFTPVKQREAYEIIQRTFGDYQSMTFAEAATSPQIPNIVVYRFRGTFGKGLPAEVRVVLGNDGKVAGFFCKGWSDSIQ